MTTSKSVSPLKLARAVLYITAQPTLMLAVVGDARWLEGWLFAAWYAGFFTISSRFESSARSACWSNELEGYVDYQRRVRYRLVPLVW